VGSHQEPHPALVALGGAVRLIREERGMNVHALAAAAGMTPAHLAALEAGRLDPDFDSVLRLADALGTCVSALVLRAEALSRDA
jgi:transcriptional regulator with XRE-family HTH domain